jgi:hypothetical protein
MAGNEEKNPDKKEVGGWINQLFPECFLLEISGFWFLCVVMVLTDPFKDTAATWLVPAAFPAYGHFNRLGVGALVLDIRNHRLV